MPTTIQKPKPQKKRTSRSPLEVLRAPSLAKLPWLAHGFSTRGGGVSKCYGSGALNLGFTGHDTKAAVERNRRAFISALSGDARRKPFPQKLNPLVTLRQIHSDLIHHIIEIPYEPLAGDGMVTNVPGIFLGILAADCLPIILVDSKKRAVGVFHAGWRGTTKRIVEKGVGEMHRWFGSDPRDLKAAIGPGIRGCCYEVGPEVQSTFEAQFSYGSELFRETKERSEIHEKYPLLFLTARAPGHSELPKKIFLDLAEANRRQLIAAGVPRKNISDLGLCTHCRRNLFFSHRGEKGVTGRMMAAVGITA
ncbi:MAG TPA: peptidoglycan editing factor PgeF [Terriglobales bacterium]|nr:peptidoglycan editing factor PgeF [Terriglobales bacterium]